MTVAEIKGRTYTHTKLETILDSMPIADITKYVITENISGMGICRSLIILHHTRAYIIEAHDINIGQIFDLVIGLIIYLPPFCLLIMTIVKT